ncbi:hypothetical protein, partial [Nocardioides sp. J9]|uniref:hypothetical protein n=1 Tax=Nocardioides sp. J9 TaxID=935844 RepID=UPI001C94C02F
LAALGPRALVDAPSARGAALELICASASPVEGGAQASQARPALALDAPSARAPRCRARSWLP